MKLMINVSNFSFTQNKLQSTADECKRSYYTSAELDYALFIHSLSFIGRLLCFKKGQSFFPMKLRDRQGETLCNIYFR